MGSVSLCSSRRLRRTLRRWLRGRRCSLECELLSIDALSAGDLLLLQPGGPEACSAAHIAWGIITSTVASGIANRLKRDANVSNARSKVL